MLVQVNPTGEVGKGGCAPDDVPGARRAGHGGRTRVDGLMTVGPTSGGPDGGAAGVPRRPPLADELGLATCSMGMTDDLEVAVEEGSTRVRLGTALFGRRP